MCLTQTHANSTTTFLTNSLKCLFLIIHFQSIIYLEGWKKKWGNSLGEKKNERTYCSSSYDLQGIGMMQLPVEHVSLGTFQIFHRAESV